MFAHTFIYLLTSFQAYTLTLIFAHFVNLDQMFADLMRMNTIRELPQLRHGGHPLYMFIENLDQSRSPADLGVRPGAAAEQSRFAADTRAHSEEADLWPKKKRLHFSTQFHTMNHCLFWPKSRRFDELGSHHISGSGADSPSNQVPRRGQDLVQVPLRDRIRQV
jgi:hypothetical protein